jgi:hypothetical protein
MDAESEIDFEVIPTVAAAAQPQAAGAAGPTENEQQIMQMIEHMARQIIDLQTGVARMRLEPAAEPP